MDIITNSVMITYYYYEFSVLLTISTTTQYLG